ncbi:hypothetical protein QBC35DRAFT_488061 [Podospora australis]|uniref:Uncharacterized protein n=1 Tax=Podospora australis TaxID=1536484 RepID=A0AAN6X2T4_9PEZI|nr:hypothetical protein QBC35DRAFT_488061 [Podospora australis]
MTTSRALATSLSSLRQVSARAPSRTLLARQVRFVNTQGEELGGVQGSEPPSPKKNPVNWRAGTITAIGVGIAVTLMLRSKAKEGDVRKAAKPLTRD